MSTAKTTTRKTAAQRAPRRRTSAKAAPADRQSMIAEAAYFRAQQRGFSGGSELSDWLAAESDIDRMLKTAKKM